MENDRYSADEEALENMVEAFEKALSSFDPEFLHRMLRSFFLALDQDFPNRTPPEGVRRGRAKALRQIADCIDPDHEEEWAEDWSELIQRLEA